MPTPLNWIRENVSLSDYSSWRVGGPARFFAEPQTIEQVSEALLWAKQNQTPVTILSGGTNVLIHDRGVEGLVLCLHKLNGVVQKISAHSRLEIEALAGTSKTELLKIFLKNQLEPALFIAGIPGDVGGGIAMNAGIGELIAPREFVEITDWIEVMRVNQQGTATEIQRYQKQELNWSYRHCNGWQPGVILRAGFSWPLESKQELLVRVRQANQTRAAKQPLELPSCGSVFINPPGFKSGALIEQCGLKGKSVGDAMISEKHANFIVNKGHAKASDIHELIEFAKKTVKAQCNVELRTEVVYMGSWS